VTRRLLAGLVFLAQFATEREAAHASDAAMLPRLSRIIDRPLLDAQGRRYRFLSDLVGSGPAILSFTFTGCRALCPPTDLIMDRVAIRLRDTGRTQVRLLTLTLDPLTDTPERLRSERAEVFDTSRVFLTGAPDDVYAVLDALGVESGADQQHDTLVLLIDRSGTRVSALPGLPDPDVIEAAADGLR
jgi:protein SCO1